MRRTLAILVVLGIILGTSTGLLSLAAMANHAVLNYLLSVIGLIVLVVGPFVLFAVDHHPKQRKRYQRAAGIAALAIGVTLFTTRLVGHIWVIPGSNVREELILSPGLTYLRTMFGPCEVHVLTVDLTQVNPVVLTAPNTAYGKECLSRMVQQHLSAVPILAATNGDFFDEGGAIGFFGHQGRFSAPKQNWSTLNFRLKPLNPSSTPIRRRRRQPVPMCYEADIDLHRLATTARVTANGVSFPIRQSYNNPYLVGDVGVYTATRGIASGAGRSDRLIQALVRLTGGTIGDIELQGTVEKVVLNPSANLQPGPNEFIVVASNEPGVPDDLGAYAWARRNFVEGGSVEAYLPLSPKPGNIAISGAPEFLRFGQYFVQHTGNKRLFERRTARTAIGITKNRRTLLVLVAEGPPEIGKSGVGWGGQFTHTWRVFGHYFVAKVLHLTSLSAGMTMEDLYRFMARHEVMGKPIDAAINLDGGGSSTMVINRQGNYAVANDPMDFEERHLPNGLAFVAR